MHLIYLNPFPLAYTHLQAIFAISLLLNLWAFIHSFPIPLLFTWLPPVALSVTFALGLRSHSPGQESSTS